MCLPWSCTHSPANFQRRRKRGKNHRKVGDGRQEFFRMLIPLPPEEANEQVNFSFCTTSINRKSVVPRLLEIDVRQIFKDIGLQGYQLSHQPGPLPVLHPSLPSVSLFPTLSVLPSSQGRRLKGEKWILKKRTKCLKQ